jgi:hypothetical protein
MEEILLATLKSFEEAESNPPSFIEICQRIGGEVSIIECNQAFVKIYKKGEFAAKKPTNDLENEQNKILLSSKGVNKFLEKTLKTENKIQID